jgi:cyclopropane fatty-acyl-phospholipid synthase-like methyltransferase
MEMFFSPAADRNKEPILKVLKTVIRPQHKRLFEIGAGTGQHAIYMAPFFPGIDWTPTEREENLSVLAKAVHESLVPNIRQPHKFQVGPDDFANFTYDIIYTANTFHIMHWKECKTLIKLVSTRLQENGKVVIYGPFNYDGKFTSPSNEEFDKALREKDPLSGIRAFEDVNKAMIKQGFELVKDYEMPANNRMLVYNRLKFVSKK